MCVYVSVVFYVVFYHVTKRGKSQNNKIGKICKYIRNHRINHANRSVIFFYFKKIYTELYTQKNRNSFSDKNIFYISKIHFI